MRKLLLFFSFAYFIADAQTPYMKMLGNNLTEWYMFQDFIPVSYSNKLSTVSSAAYYPTYGKCAAYTDTIVGLHTYKKFYHVYISPGPGPGSHVGYIREDSAARKVYFLDKSSSTEELLYDFSVAVGDSVYYTFPNTSGTFPIGYYKLKSITTVTTPLGLRNEYNFLYKNGSVTSDTLRQIESIGCDIHPIYLHNSSYGPGQFQWASSGCQWKYDIGLACKFTDNVKAYQSCTWVTAQTNGCIFKQDSCNYWNTCSGINELDQIRNFDISPNPSSGLCNVTLELADAIDVSVEVFDVIGKKVQFNSYKGLNSGNHRIILDLGHLETGMYYVNLKGQNFELHKPLIIER